MSLSSMYHAAQFVSQSSVYYSRLGANSRTIIGYSSGGGGEAWANIQIGTENVFGSMRNIE